MSGQKKSLAYAYDRTGVSVGTDEYADRVVQRLALIEVVENRLTSSGLKRCCGEHAYSVELERSHVVDLHLQILELTIVVLRVGGVLHHAFAQSLSIRSSG